MDVGDFTERTDVGITDIGVTEGGKRANGQAFFHV